VTQAEVQTLLDAWTAAELAVATGQAYTIGGRSLTRADAAFIVKMREKYQAQLEGLVAGRGGGVRVIRVVPRDL
jgi:hypothetical protein